MKNILEMGGNVLEKYRFPPIISLFSNIIYTFATKTRWKNVCNSTKTRWKNVCNSTKTRWKNVYKTM